jgi:hypothetical protein
VKKMTNKPAFCRYTLKTLGATWGTWGAAYLLGLRRPKFLIWTWGTWGKSRNAVQRRLNIMERAQTFAKIPRGFDLLVATDSSEFPNYRTPADHGK